MEKYLSSIDGQETLVIMLRKKKSSRYYTKKSATNESTRSVGVLFIGAGLGQVIPIAISPVLTRIYTPEEFGIFAIFTSFVSLLVATISGRYELAVMLQKSERDAVNMVAGVLAITGVLGLIFSTVIYAYYTLSLGFFGVIESESWVYLIPISASTMIILATINNWLNRKNKYKLIAGNELLYRVNSEGARTIVGLNNYQFVNGLITGQIIGQLISVMFSASLVWKKAPWNYRHIRLLKMMALLKKYRKFPLYTMPFTLVSTIGRESLVILLVSFGNVGVAGLFMIARRILMGPVLLISASLGRVFFKEAILKIGTPQLGLIVDRLMNSIVELFTPLFVFMVIWAPDVFEVVFGIGWRESGEYASVITPIVFISMLTSWSRRLYEVSGQQNVALIIQTLADIMRISAVYISLKNGLSGLEVIKIYALVSVIHQFAFLVGILHVGKIKMRVLYIMLARVCFLAPLSYYLFISIKNNFKMPESFILTVSIMMIYFFTVCYVWTKRTPFMSRV
jgi:O-antigen/teichoic acid export membrane protein